MNLGSRLATAFALVAIVVAATVGVLSYQAAAYRIGVETDRSLEAATTAIAGGQDGVLEQPVVDLGALRRPDRTPRPGDEQDLTAQHVAADGTVSRVGGRDVALPVGDVERGLAQPTASAAATTEVTVGGDTYRVLTTALGPGDPADDEAEFDGGALQVAVDIDGSQRVLSGLATQILVVSLVVALVAGGAGWLVSRRITRRLVQLTDAAEQVAAGGPGEYAVLAGGRDEVGRLSSSFRTMLHRLAESRDTQERLVQDAAHELRTPLTSLRTNARVLRRIDDLSPASRERLVADLEGETRELSHLVDELVALALTREAVESEEDLVLGEVTARVAERVARRTGREVTVDADAAVVRGSPTALERAVGNLVENAAKFDAATVDGAEPITVEVRRGTVTVSDHGPGIPDEALPRVFDRFYRAQDARALPGSGLGLAIVRDVALAHEGTVFARNRPAGGAVVGFTVGPAKLLPDSHPRHDESSPPPTTLDVTRTS